MNKVLVTGATGFVGSYVVENLVEKGFHVIASSSNKEKAASQDWFDKVVFREFNLDLFEDTTDYFKLFHEPDFMIHLAWEGLPDYKNDAHINTYLPRHILFLKNMISNGLKDMTVTGTCLEYGMQEGCLSEDLPCKPSTAYAFAKNELREEMVRYSVEMKCSFKWLRLFYMYGKGQHPKSLMSQLEKAIDQKEKVFNMSGGEQVRDFLHVNVIAKQIVSIARQKTFTGIINCCSGIPISVKDFIQTYLKQRKKSIQLNLNYYDYTDYEPMKFWGETKRLDKIIKK